MKTVCMHCDPLNKEANVSHGYCGLPYMHKDLWFTFGADSEIMQRYWIKYVKPYLDGAKIEEIFV